jgi:hypothetical protein
MNRNSKGVLFSMIMTLLFFAGASFQHKPTVVSNLAKVESENGIFIFIRSTPAGDYESLGAVNMPEIVWSGKAGEMVGNAVKRAGKQYPNANGVIIRGDNLGKVEAVLIK